MTSPANALLRTLAGASIALAVTACSTTTPVLLQYGATSDVVRARSNATVVVGSFVDQRGEPANWLGAIRNGWGAAVQNLESDRPVSAVVQTAFADGLRARGVAIDSPGAQYQLAGVIRLFDCNQYSRREANAEIELTVIDTATGLQRFSRTYKAYTLDGSIFAAGGWFADVEDLRVTTARVLREVVDKALDDSALRAALQI